MDNPTEMISFGAGVNSVAMTILLVNEGWRGHIVFADPGAEHPDTYCYIDYFEREWLKPRGLEVTRISPELTPEFYQPADQMSLLDKCESMGITPLMMARWCTDRWKARPLNKWAKEHGIGQQYIGIALEESHRARFSERFGLSIEYPLVDRGIARDGCRAIIEHEGLSVPPKSGCWFCPFQKKSEWRALYDLRPDLFWRAASMDDAACSKSQVGQLCLGVNLGMNLSQAGRMWDAQLELPGMPEPHYEYQMCECRL